MEPIKPCESITRGLHFKHKGDKSQRDPFPSIVPVDNVAGNVDTTIENREKGLDKSISFVAQFIMPIVSEALKGSVIH